MSTNPALDRIKSRGQTAVPLEPGISEEPLPVETTPVPVEWTEAVTKEDGASSTASALQGPLQGDESKGGSMSSAGVSGPKKKFKKRKENYADPDDKKLPIGDAGHLAQAITALSPGGFRGHKVQFDKGSKTAAVKKIGAQIDKSGLSDDKKQHLRDRLNKSKGYISPRSPSFWDRNKVGIAVFKSADGHRLAFLVTSNSYTDREDETVKTVALKGYVEDSWSRVEDQCVTKNTFHLWHGGDPIGDIVWCDMEGPFLIEVAKERPDSNINLAREDQDPVRSTVKEVWDYIESHPKELDSISQGFHFYKNPRFSTTKTYDRIYKFESSVLPRQWASNSLTLAEVFNVAPRDELLEKITGAKGTASKAKNLRRGIKNVVKTLGELGIQHKEIETEEVPDEVTKGLIEDMETRVKAFLADLTDEADVDDMVPQIIDIVMSCIGEMDEDDSPDADYKADGYQYDETDPSLQPAHKQLQLMDGLIQTQEGLLKELTSISKTVKSLQALSTLPDAFEGITDRLSKVEKQLRLRPKGASSDSSTEIEDEDIFQAVKEQLSRVDPFFGVHVADNVGGISGQ